MGTIKRRAAEEIKRTVQWAKGQMSQGASFADPSYPIRLAKTTATHATGATQDVKLLWGDKGSETEGVTNHDTVPAYNRYGAIEADEEVHIARIGPGWEILNRSTSGPAGSCGACTEAAGTQTVDLGSGAMASEYYRFYPFCGQSVYFPLAKDASGNVWIAPASIPATVPCDSADDPVGLSAELTHTSLLRDQNEIVITQETEGEDDPTWKFRNDTFWQPEYPHFFYYYEGDADCPCNSWERDACLIPVSEEEGLADIQTLEDQAEE
jgi:hypothetical protein